MALLDSLKDLIAQYSSGGTPAGDPGEHFQEVARSVDPETLTQGISAAMRSNDTPPFSQLVSQLFSSGSLAQKTGMLNTLLASATPELRTQIASLIPGLGSATSVTNEQAAALPPSAVQTLAEKVQQRDAGIIEKMSTFYAAHPMLVKTLGTTAMAIAMRRIAERQR